MTLHKRWSASLSSAMWLVLTLGVWAVFAPVPMGGNSAYVIVNGISMEPNFHLGDLIIVNPSPHYGVGDAVVYRNQGMGGANVFHRIVELKQDRYVLKGDNNSWIDTYQPTRTEVLGKLWIHIPSGGRFLEKARTPAWMALLAGGLGLFIATSFLPERRKGKKQMKRNRIREWFASLNGKIASFFAGGVQAGQGPRKPSKRPPSDMGSMSEILFFTLGIIAFSSLILAIVSFSRPAFRTVADNIIYQHLGVYSYSTNAPEGVYDANTVKSGDPLFPGLTCKVNVGFQYILIAAQTENIAATHQLTAVIADPLSGWERSLPLEAATPFSQNSAMANTALDLCKIESLIQSFEETSGAGAGIYELTISPHVYVSANIQGGEFEDTFNPDLKFKYDGSQFYILKEGEGDPFNPVKMGTLGRERKEADIFSLFGLTIQIPILRVVSILGLAGALTGILFLWQNLQKLSENDQAEFIRTKFGSQLVDVQKTKLGSSKTLIDVSTIDDLAKLAERHNTMILHETQESGHVYYVQAEISTYRFTLNTDPNLTDIP